MKKTNKKPQKREYFILEEWLPALQKLDGFSLLAVEFKKNTNGFVYQDSREAICLRLLDAHRHVL